MGDSEKTLASPWRVVGAAWAILLAILLVYSGDIRSWAAMKDSTVAGTVRPLAGALCTAASGSGVQTFVELVQRHVYGYYDAQPVWASRERGVSRASSLPAAAPQVNALAATPATGNAQQVEAQAVFAPTRILIVGASSIQEGLGTELERALEGYKGITIKRVGQYSSGLARPDYFDWPKKVGELKAEFKPDLIIAQFGENDCQGLSTNAGAFLAKFGTDDWDKAYGERVEKLVASMETDGCHAALIGIPAMRNKSFSQQVTRLNGVTQKHAEAGGGLFLSTWDITTDAGGKYISSLTIDGKARVIRTGDGVHLTNQGATYVAGKLVEKLKLYFTLTPK